MKYNTVFKIEYQNPDIKISTSEKWGRLRMAMILILSDLFALLAAFNTGLFLRLGVQMDIDSYRDLLGILIIVFPILFYQARLYPAVGFSPAEEMRKIVMTTTFVFLFLVVYTFLVKSTAEYSRLALLVGWGLALVFVPAMRWSIQQIMYQKKWWGENVVVIGEAEKSISVAKYFLDRPNLGMRPVAVFSKVFVDDLSMENVLFISTDLIREYININHISTALVLAANLNHVDNLIEKYRFLFKKVVLIKQQTGCYGLNSLTALDFDEVLGLQVQHNLLDRGSQIIKRIMDITGSGLGLLFLLPWFLLFGLLIRLDSPGQIFYRQVRMGKNGKPIQVIKFRSMFQNADQVLQQKLSSDPQIKEEWHRYQKIKKDPRITRVGAFMRKYSLDELPQLWNVFVGEMSLVGPRPILLNQADLYGDGLCDYQRVSPGLTGWWQVSGRNQTTFIRRAQLDMEYIQKWSLWLDIYILIMTIKTVLLREGAY